MTKPVIYDSCVICGQNFRKKGLKKTCSTKCSHLLKRQTFKDWYRRNKNYTYRTCVICGSSFILKGSSLTCSKECSKERMRRYKKKYYKANKKYHQVLSSIWAHVYRLRLILLLDAVCVRCGFSDLRALEVDHVQGGGRADQRKKGNHFKMYMYYFENPELAREELQVLCSNCNSIKRFENKENRG